MVTKARERYPDFSDLVRALVEEHRTEGGEPVLLAVYFAPSSDDPDVHLFEVIDGFGGNDISEDRQFFEIGFGPTAGFTMQEGQILRLLLTNPVELEEALREGEGWSGLDGLRGAIRSGRVELVFKDDRGGELWEKLRRD